LSGVFSSYYSISQKENSSKKESKKDIKKIEKSKDEEEKDHSLSTSNVDSSPCCSSTQFGILTCMFYPLTK